METKIIKFDKLKQQAEYILRNQLRDFSNFDVRKYHALVPAVIESAKQKRRISPQNILDEWTEKAVDIINHWDVRKVKQLLEAFPGILPTYAKYASIVCDYDESGEWIVILTNHY